MAIIKIIRSDEFVNRGREIKIWVNGQLQGKIGNGQEKQFSVPGGAVVLHAAIDWCSSNQIRFSVSDSECRSFVLQSFAKGKRPNGLSALYHIFFAPARYLLLADLP